MSSLISVDFIEGCVWKSVVCLEKDLITEIC